MTDTYSFELIIRGDVTDDGVEQLYRAAPDATVSTSSGVTTVAFDRPVDGYTSFGQALFRAIRQVEEAMPVRAIGVERSEGELLTLSEIARRVHRTPESIRQLVMGLRGPGGFPPPASNVDGRSKRWRWQDVAAWMMANGLDVEGVEGDLAAAAANAALELRELAPELDEESRREAAELAALDMR
jgi:hypothetical protein